MSTLPPSDGSPPSLIPTGDRALQGPTDAGGNPVPQPPAARAAAPHTLRAYKADWQHFAGWCEAHGFQPVPATPAVVGAYLASLAETHAPATIRRRLAALGKMHRFNDLAWDPGHPEIQAPLRGARRMPGRTPRQAAPLTLALLRRLLATCDRSARGRRDRALLLFGFAGALRRSELVGLQVEDVAEVAGGLRLRIGRGKAEGAGQEAEIGLPRGRDAEICPVQAFAGWQAVAKRRAGPLFRRISTGGTIGDTALHADAVRRILDHRCRLAGIAVDGGAPLTPHALRTGFIHEACERGVRDEDIMRHTRHRDLRSVRGQSQRGGRVTESPPGALDF